MREVVTYLDLEITVVPCARGSRHRAHVAAAAQEILGKDRPSFPYLEDDAAGVGHAYSGHTYSGHAYYGHILTVAITMAMLAMAILAGAILMVMLTITYGHAYHGCAFCGSTA